MESSEALNDSLRALSRFFLGHLTLQQTLQQVLELGQQSVEAADIAGITMLDESGRPSTTVFTSGESPEIDQAQYEQGAGPCLTAFHEGIVVRIDSMADETRWPAFAKAALDHGVLSTLSTPMSAAGVTIGALNLYARTAHAFTEEAESQACMFAEHAAVPLANAQAYSDAFSLSENLTEAMRSRSIIEQAKGILMSRHQLTAEAAFRQLRERSQRQNRKVRDLAQALVEEQERQSRST